MLRFLPFPFCSAYEEIQGDVSYLAAMIYSAGVTPTPVSVCAMEVRGGWGDSCLKSILQEQPDRREGVGCKRLHVEEWKIAAEKAQGALSLAKHRVWGEFAPYWK